MMAFRLSSAAIAASLAATVSAQTFQRLGTCPTLGCILPPDAQDFLAGQYFDIRLEVHAPVNGSEATDGMFDPTAERMLIKASPMPAMEIIFADINQVFPTRTSPSPLARLVKRLARLRSSSMLKSPSLRPGTSHGTSISRNYYIPPL